MKYVSRGELLREQSQSRNDYSGVFFLQVDCIYIQNCEVMERKKCCNEADEL